MSALIETIKEKVDLVEEVELVVPLQKSGKSLKGLCPFHNERTPSFYVFPESQTWRCFGCHEGGDLFTFVEKQQSIEFWDALLYLAQKAGVPVDEQARGDPQEAREAHARKERLYKLNEDASLWFHQALLRSREATGARAYLQERGISSDSVINFSLGYAPERWDSLSIYLLAHDYTESELVTAGLAREREKVSEQGQERGIYDYFRNRLIFPIRDIRGKIIGFGGRVLSAEQPKYLNSPQTLLFEKNTVLYAIDMARDAIKQENQVIIVEGYVDALIAHQYGTRQTVACIGSAITEKHIQQLKKMTRQVTLALDPDAAGAAATEHGIQEALKGSDRKVVPVLMPAGGANPLRTGRGKQPPPRAMVRLEEQADVEINVLQLPEGEDPDEVIRRDFTIWDQAVKHPLPLVDYYFISRTSGLNLREPAGQAEAARRLLPLVAAISDRARRDLYLHQLARLLRMDERSLNEDLLRILRGQHTSGVVAAFTDQRSERPVESGQSEKARKFGLDKARKDRLEWEDYLLGLLLRNPQLSQHVCGIINDGDFAGTDTRELYHIFNSVFQRGSSPLYQPLEMPVPAALQETVERVQKCVAVTSFADDAHLIKDARQCAIRLKRACLLQSETELRYLLKEAEEVGDATAKLSLRLQVNVVARQLFTLDSAMRLHG
jgi:DNA primase